jgi:hypothetical protein
MSTTELAFIAAPLHEILRSLCHRFEALEPPHYAVRMLMDALSAVAMGCHHRPGSLYFAGVWAEEILGRRLCDSGTPDHWQHSQFVCYWIAQKHLDAILCDLKSLHNLETRCEVPGLQP